MNYESMQKTFSFLKELYIIFSDAQKSSIQSFWNLVIMPFIEQNGSSIIWFIFIMLIIAFIKAEFGRWGLLGSLLYNIFYLGILLIIGLIFGPEIFANILFEFAIVIIYLVSYDLSGIVLNKFNFK